MSPASLRAVLGNPHFSVECSERVVGGTVRVIGAGVAGAAEVEERLGVLRIVIAGDDRLGVLDAGVPQRSAETHGSSAAGRPARAADVPAVTDVDAADRGFPTGLGEAGPAGDTVQAPVDYVTRAGCARPCPGADSELDRDEALLGAIALHAMTGLEPDNEDDLQAHGDASQGGAVGVALGGLFGLALGIAAPVLGLLLGLDLSQPVSVRIQLATERVVAAAGGADNLRMELDVVRVDLGAGGGGGGVLHHPRGGAGPRR